MPRVAGEEFLYSLLQCFSPASYFVKVACISDRSKVLPKTRIGHWYILIDTGVSFEKRSMTSSRVK